MMEAPEIALFVGDHAMISRREICERLHRVRAGIQAADVE